ncbi:SGNH hydrolase-type esterase domain containing protein [Elaphomyces granulatus]|jgi:lysophospholipase L1-like esterase
MFRRFLVAIFVLLHTAAALPPANILRRSASPPTHYYALGDSYASGIAAGNYIDSKINSPDWKCSRFDHAYGKLLDGMLDGQKSRDFHFLACSGNTCQDVQKTQKPSDNADLVTLTVGGNDVGFSDIVEACVYQFAGILTSNCDTALTQTQNNIAGPLWNSLWNTIESIVTTVGKSNKNFKLFVTNYPQFWNQDADQCDSISFSYWLGPSSSDKMTKDKRTKMNNLSKQMNAVILSVVENWNNPQSSHYDTRVHYVDIDSAFEGHRFCENEYQEPWWNDEPNGRPDQWIFQLFTEESLRSARVGAQGDGLYYVQEMQKAQKNDPSLTPPSNYAPYLVKPGDNLSGGLPLSISKIFHPTSNGQQAIANAIQYSYNALG